MSRIIFCLFCAIVLVTPVLPAVAGGGTSDWEVARSPQTQALWIENRGQWPEPILFVAEVDGGLIRIEADAASIQTGSDPTWTRVARFRVPGASGDPTGGGRAETRFHFYHGGDPAKWRTNVPAFDEVSWPSGARVRALTSGLVTIDGAPHERLSVEGAAIVDGVAGGATIDGITVAWAPLSAGSDVNRVSDLSSRAESAWREGLSPLVAQSASEHPDWSTYIGGDDEGPEMSRASTISEDGRVVGAGMSAASAFPLSPGLHYGVGRTQSDEMRIVCFEATTGALLWSALVGGSAQDFPDAIAVGPDGRIAVGGKTESTDWPLTKGALDSMLAPALTKLCLFELSADGSQMLFSTYIGKASQGDLNALAYSEEGQLAIGGVTAPFGEPNLGEYVPPDAADSKNAGIGADGFVLVLAPETRDVEWASYVGGDELETVTGLAFDDGGALVATGWTLSEAESQLTGGFPITPGAYKVASPGFDRNAFVSRFAPDGKSFEYSAYIGAQGMVEPYALSLAPDGSVVVGGATGSYAFPVTAGVIDPVNDSVGGGQLKEGFAFMLSPDGTQLDWATYFGGVWAFERVVSVDVDASGVVTLFGKVMLNAMTPFEMTEVYGVTDNDGVFACRLAPGATEILYGVALSDGATPTGTAGGGVFPNGDVGLGGTAWTPLFPVSPGAYDTVFTGTTEFFAAKLDMLPNGVTRFGESSAGCVQPSYLGTTRTPLAGASDFELYVSCAPAASAGVLVLGAPGEGLAVPGVGAMTWIDLRQPTLTLPWWSGATGHSKLALPLPAGSSGLAFALQAFFPSGAACPGAPPIQWSHSLRVEVR